MHTPFSAGRISAGSMADYLPLLTAAVSFALTALLLRQYLNRRKLHQLVWTASLGLLGLAAVLAYLGNADVVGWNEALYKAYLPLTALPVGLIGLGVLQLFRDRPALARTYGVYWVATAILVIVVTVFAPLRPVPRPRRGPVLRGGLQQPARGPERVLRDHRLRGDRDVPRLRPRGRA